MYFKISYAFLFMLISSIRSSNIRDCSEKTNTATVCKLVKTYKKSSPPDPYPLTVNTSINILDIMDFDWTAKTMTLFIELWMWWRDPRITITDYSEGKEEGLILYFQLEAPKAFFYLTFISFFF